MTRQPVPLVVVYSDGSHASVGQHCEFQMGDTRVPDEHTSHQSETSTSGREEATTEPISQPRVTIVHRGNPRKSWRNWQVLLSGNWESPSGTSVRFRIPTTFQIAGRSPACRSVPAINRVYPRFLFTENLIRAGFTSPAKMMDTRRSTEAKRMNESSKRRLMMSLKEKKKNQQPKTVSVQLAEVDPEVQTLTDRLRGAVEADSMPRRGQTTEALASKSAEKRPITVDLDAKLVSKRGRQTEAPRAVFAAEEDDSPAEPITIACPSKTVQFANHMILRLQMELSEIDELPKRLLQEEAERAFRLQASVSFL
ncbi:unnamed protein product, partial [Prunus brigantina]